MLWLIELAIYDETKSIWFSFIYRIQGKITYVNLDVFRFRKQTTGILRDQIKSEFGKNDDQQALKKKLLYCVKIINHVMHGSTSTVLL